MLGRRTLRLCESQYAASDGSVGACAPHRGCDESAEHGAMEHARLGVMDRQIRYGADLVGYLGRQGITAELHHDDRLLLALLAISPPSLIVLHEAPAEDDSLETLRQ